MINLVSPLTKGFKDLLTNPHYTTVAQVLATDLYLTERQNLMDNHVIMSPFDQY